MEVLSGHGGGATGDFLPDDDPPSALTIPRLAQMLKPACRKLKSELDRSRLHILGMDSCLMSMVEVGYEVQDCVEYMIGSEGFVPNAGWPYHRVLEVLAESKTADAAVENIVRKYAAYYQDHELGGQSTHIAAVRLEAFGRPKKEIIDPEKLIEQGNLATAIQFLANRLREGLAKLDHDEEQQELGGRPRTSAGTIRDAILLAHWYVQSFLFEKYVDLWDFCDQLMRFLPPGYADDVTTIRTCCSAVKHWIDQAVQRSLYCGPDFQHTHGLSVFFPWSLDDFSGEYRNLKFARETGWHDFLEMYLQKTQRLRRGQATKRDGAEPFRMGSDVDQLHRYGSHYAARYGSHYAARYGSHYAARYGSHYAARMQAALAGKAATGNFKNLPDGFFRQDHSKPDTFIARNESELEEGYNEA
jgi:hypothetical protein